MGRTRTVGLHHNIINNNISIKYFSLFPSLSLSLSLSLSPCQIFGKTDKIIDESIEKSIEDVIYQNLKNYFYNKLDEKSALDLFNEWGYDDKVFEAFEDALVQKADEDYWFFLREFLLNKEEREKLKKHD